MKTTLKRGVGRSANGNGNGHSVFPPGPISTITRYRAAAAAAAPAHAPRPAHPDRDAARRCSRSARPWPAASYLYVHQTVDDLRPHGEGQGADRDAEGARRSRRGTSPPSRSSSATTRASATTPTRSRSDTLMLIRADPATKSISMLSFPRDLGVHVYCPGATPVYDRINSAYARCGIEGHARDGPQADRPPDPLPDHRQLPRLQADRRQARRRLARHRPPLLQQERRQRGDELRRHRPAARLPAARRRARARVRPLPPHRRRLPPPRAPAAVRAGVQGAGGASTATTTARCSQIICVVTDNVEVGSKKGFDERDRARVRDPRGDAAGRAPLPGRRSTASRATPMLTAPEGAIADAVQQFENPDVGESKVANNAALGRKPKAPKVPAPKDTTVTVLNGSGHRGRRRDRERPARAARLHHAAAARERAAERADPELLPLADLLRPEPEATRRRRRPR